MIPTRSRDSWTRSVNSGRAVTHVVEPRRVARQLAKKYRDAAAWGSECRFAGAGGGTPVGSGNLHNIAGANAALVPRPSSSDADKSLHASGVKASMRASRAHHPPWWPVVRRPCSRAVAARTSTTGL